MLNKVVNFNQIQETNNLKKDISNFIYKRSFSKVVIFTQRKINDTVWFDGISDDVFYINDGEESKNISNVIESIEFLIKIGADRNCLLVAYGGGSVTDHVGFVASIYKRGVSYVNVPTTLIGMVDASIGGKTAVNINTIKNQIGTFYHPKRIFLNFNVLDTMPRKLINNGMGEIYKYAILQGGSAIKNLNNYLNDNNKNDLISIIKTCYEYKYHIVKNDETDTGLRKILNLGHTFGHAIESESNNNVDHGEAVINGILMSSYYSFCNYSLEEKEYKLIESTGLRLIDERYKIKKVENFVKFILNDKKNVNNKIGIIIIKNLGNVQFTLNNVKNVKNLITRYNEYINN